MKEVFLTKEIDNDEGYVDTVVSEIKAVPPNEELKMLITCVGGDIFQGDRINRAVLEHNSKTTAVVIGLAASMGAVILPAFDDIEIDSDAEIMLHKAHIPGIDNEDLSKDQREGIARFNRRAFARLEAKGVDKDLLDKIFLSDSIEDVWLTAKEAETMGIGKAVKIERKDYKPLKIAAQLQVQQTKNKNNMGLFTKSKAVTRLATLKDGRQVVFKGEKETPQVGDLVNLVGSNELITGKIQIKNVVAELDEEQKVASVEEVNDEVNDEEKAALMERLDTLESAVQKLMEAMGGSEEDEEAEAKAMEEKEKEYENKMEELENATKSISDLLKNSIEVAKNIKSGYKPEKFEDKHEPVMDRLKGLSDSERRAIELRNVLKEAKQK